MDFSLYLKLVNGRLIWKRRDGEPLFNSYYPGKEAGGSDPSVVKIKGTEYTKKEIVEDLS